MLKLLATMAPTLVLVIYSQLVTTWRLGQMIASPGHAELGRLAKVITYMTDFWVLSGYAAALAGGMAWMFVLEKYAVSLAFPVYIGVIVSTVAVAGVLLFGEALPWTKLAGILLIVGGVTLVSRT